MFCNDSTDEVRMFEGRLYCLEDWTTSWQIGNMSPAYLSLVEDALQDLGAEAEWRRYEAPLLFDRRHAYMKPNRSVDCKSTFWT
jgi:hypothetical protein